MKNDGLLYVPMLERKWRHLSFLFFPLPVVIVIVLALLQVGLSPDNAAEIIYGSWAVGFTLLNLTKEKIEDEMVKTFRLQAFQTGFFWLMCGLVAIMVVNYLRFGEFSQEIFSAPLVLFLLNAYVFAAFEYQKWRSNQ
jgi:hypothetical protein